jgi:hypothetical protein
MATGNFYTGGNHGLNVIIIPDEEEDNMTVEDTIANIVAELSSKGYSVDSADNLTQAPRSFETGTGYLVYNKNAKIVAFLELCAGYYSGANIDIYTGDALIDISDDGYDYDNEVTKNKRDIDRVVKCVEMYTDGFRKKYQFSNGETWYERGK